MLDTYKVGYWAWELPTVPESWLPAFDLVDEIWTVSSFAAQAFKLATDKPVATLPIAISDWSHSSRRDARDRLRIPLTNEFAFLTIFDFASGFSRKNPLGVIEAFNLAFGKSPSGPHLIIKYRSVQGYQPHALTADH